MVQVAGRYIFISYTRTTQYFAAVAALNDLTCGDTVALEHREPPVFVHPIAGCHQNLCVAVTDG
jgi:hypothetical protein